MIESAFSMAIPSPGDSSDSGRKINQHLVRALNSRKKKMRFLFDCLGEFQQVFVEQESLLKQITEALESNSSSLIKSDIRPMPSRKKIHHKRNRLGEEQQVSNPKDTNIFKRNSSIGSLKPKVFEQDIKFPIISRRSHQTESFERTPDRHEKPTHSEVFTETKKEKSISTTVDSGKKVCRIPMERLVPLSVDEIKQRIERKFK